MPTSPRQFQPASIRSTPVGPITTGPLPTELAAHRQARLGLVGLFYAGLFLSGWVAQSLVVMVAGKDDMARTLSESAFALQTRFPLGVVAGTLAVLGGIALWARARKPNQNSDNICNASFMFQVLGAFCITMSEQWATSSMTNTLSTGSWIAVWIVLFPMLVPTFPKRALSSALFSASMVPVAYALNRWCGATAAGPGQLAALVFPGYLAAIVAYFASRFIYDLGTTASRAKKLGAYEIGEAIGAGGMGEVWQAEHELLKRPAAVKIIRPERLASDEGDTPDAILRRFSREAKATAVLQSPHTVTVYDYGITEDGTFYYVMELLRGLNLQELVERFGPLPSVRVADLLAQLLTSLADAHANGLIHRDIKPANVFAARLGTQFDFVKVLDFGLVTAAKGDAVIDATRATQDGVTSGTPAYLAPEIATGDAEVGPAVDIYAVGCVAYYLLTGQLVFDADSALQVVLRHVRETPKPPSAVTEMPVHPDLERLVMQMLEKNPRDRPSSAQGLACALRRIEFDTHWGQMEAVTWWQRHAPELTQGIPAVCEVPAIKLSA